MGIIPLSFADPRFLVVEDEVIYSVDELTEEVLNGLSAGVLRIVDLKEMCEVMADGTTLAIPDIDDTEIIEELD